MHWPLICLRDDDDDDENGKFILLDALLDTAVRELGTHGAFGMVFTDGAASFACGYKNNRWWIFDSHGRASLWRGDQEAAEDCVCIQM